MLFPRELSRRVKQSLSKLRENNTILLRNCKKYHLLKSQWLIVGNNHRRLAKRSNISIIFMRCVYLAPQKLGGAPVEYFTSGCSLSETLGNIKESHSTARRETFTVRKSGSIVWKVLQNSVNQPAHFRKLQLEILLLKFFTFITKTLGNRWGMGCLSAGLCLDRIARTLILKAYAYALIYILYPYWSRSLFFDHVVLFCSFLDLQSQSLFW